MYVQFTSHVVSFRKWSILQISEESDVEERDGTRSLPLQTSGEVAVAVNLSNPGIIGVVALALFFLNYCV